MDIKFHKMKNKRKEGRKQEEDEEKMKTKEEWTNWWNEETRLQNKLMENRPSISENS